MRIVNGKIEFRVPKIPKPFPESVYAFCFWPFIFYESHVWDDECVQVHERYHWNDQIKWLIIPWYIRYFILKRKYGGGKEHPMENQAYALQETCNEGSAP